MLPTVTRSKGDRIKARFSIFPNVIERKGDLVWARHNLPSLDHSVLAVRQAALQVLEPGLLLRNSMCNYHVKGMY